MRDQDIDEIVAALAAISKKRCYSHNGLAKLLGLSPGYLSMIFRRKRRPGLRLLQRALAQFPEIRQLVSRQMTIEPHKPPSSKER